MRGAWVTLAEARSLPRGKGSRAKEAGDAIKRSKSEERRVREGKIK